VTVPPTPPGWGTTTATVQAMLGPTVPFATDPNADLYVDAANRWCFRKRYEAGYDDTANPVAEADVVVGCSLYAQALWRERASTDGYTSFEDFPAAALVGGSLGQIRRLLGVPKSRTDTVPDDVADILTLRRRRRIGWRW
jgi:hypothetical protein